MKIKLDPLDRLFACYIKLRDKVCQRCGGSGGLQTSHFHGRRKKTIRWNEDNCCLLCMGCHMYFHANPLVHTEWFRERLGDTNFELLNIQANLVGIKPDIKAIELYIKEKIKLLEE